MKNKALYTDIYVIPVPDAYLVYSPLRRVTALVNHKAVSILKEQLANPRNEQEIPESLQGLLQELRQPVKEPPPDRTGPVQPKFLGILPTRACNLSCIYCDFGSHNAPQEVMEIRMAAAAVDWAAKTVKELGRDTLEIHFFGGEPFFAPDVIDVTVHRARAVAVNMGLTPRFEVSTNGVFDEQRARFVGDYFDAVVLSFDGFQKIHDRQRGSFEMVKRTATILSQSPTELCLRVCVSQESVQHLERIAQWFCEEFRPSVVNFEVLQSSSKAESAGLQPPNPYDFAVHYTQASRIVESFGIEAIYVSASTDTLRHSFCLLGKDAVIVSPDGRVSGCYLQQQD